MAVNPFFGNKKRSSSLLYGVNQSQSSTSAPFLQGSAFRGKNENLGDHFPPNKRYKGNENKKPEAAADPFEDEFTADDLEEIDILASQAQSQGLGLEASSTNPSSAPVQKTRVSFTLSTGDQKAVENWSQNSVNTIKKSTKDLDGSSIGLSKDTDSFGFQVLQVQHEELKKKLKEIQEEILTKNGEIKVLRDSLRYTGSELDQHKRAQVVLEKEKTQAQSEREKELSKKVQSLQSELQFKDAEMNELRTKIQNLEVMSKPAVPPITKLSPRQSPSGIVKPESCTSPVVRKNAFPTKELFIAEPSPKVSSSPVQQPNQSSLRKEEKACTSAIENVQDKISKITLFSSFQRHLYNTKLKGPMLLNILLRKPVGPRLLGLCHLLSVNPEALPGLVLQPNYYGSGSTGKSSIHSTDSKTSSERSFCLSEVKSLAISGLNMLTLDQGLLDDGLLEKTKGFSRPGELSSLLGAVYILPLLDYHIGIYCEALQTTDRSAKSSSISRSLCSSSSQSSVASSIEDSVFSLEDTAVAALSILYHLVFHSRAVINSLLSPLPSEDDAQTIETEETKVLAMQLGFFRPLKQTAVLQEAVSSDQSYHPLFRKLLQLLDHTATNSTLQSNMMLNQSLKVLVKMAENSTVELLPRFQPLLNGQQLLRCLPLDLPCSVACLAAQMLAVFTDCKELTACFCSQSDTCLLLTLCTYATSRPDKLASDRSWLQLEQEVVRFLTKAFTQISGAYTVFFKSDCHCSNEVVKAIILMLHRQWLSIRKCKQNVDLLKNPVVQFLREAVLLLHCLFQKDKNFSEHCLDVIHQYDYAMHGIRALFSKVKDLKEYEELALEELCPAEPETEITEIESLP
ncbi:ATR-interacting protein isoform X1 [Latimeria chalumnae]|uniref:ATR-interacting protein isoform X1 n=1 Tax=Latimeria chalumnae TaxID=7897 RepID=UPI0006D9391B|nr:PREDICTED: ATR-interacting protein isoform X2 [Latimeria chalumnae]XP_014344401.1 PREDICTED: ATR-interacting protein isoform X2 [Latimeria chalumnae]|eukprot:XP_014344397.1 PREDICTED: ATR-interacting protein isoform X2 [Latimeria chalumnae]